VKKVIKEIDSSAAFSAEISIQKLNKKPPKTAMRFA